MLKTPSESIGGGASGSDRRVRSLPTAICGLLVVGAMLKFVALAGAAGIIWIHLCGSWTPGAGSTGGTIGVAHSGASENGVSTPYQCPSTPTGAANGMEVFGGGASVSASARAYWQIDAPSGLVIMGVHTEGSGMLSYGVDSALLSLIHI